MFSRSAGPSSADSSVQTHTNTVWLLYKAISKHSRVDPPKKLRQTSPVGTEEYYAVTMLLPIHGINERCSQEDVLHTMIYASLGSLDMNKNSALGLFYASVRFPIF